MQSSYVDHLSLILFLKDLILFQRQLFIRKCAERQDSYENMTLQCHIIFDKIFIKTDYRKPVDQMQINRLFEIVYILMNKKSTTTKELSEHFEVSQRTIYRDIETLCQAGIPIYTTKGKGGGIGLLEHFILNKSLLSDQEQSDILSALQGLKATSYADTDKVLSKLNSMFGNKGQDWIEVDFSYWNSNEEDKQKFGQLKDAILSHRIIQFDYYNSYGQESHRTLEPGKLVFKGQAWYLYGYCRDKKDERFFKISRIKSLQIDNVTFSPSPLLPPKEKEQ
jgi:predicted DNA-binding transcriptional regulator YafY